MIYEIEFLGHYNVILNSGVVVHLNCRLSDILTSESINKNKFLNVSPNPFFYIQKTQNTMSYIFNTIISYHSKILKQVIIVTRSFPYMDNK